MIPNMIKVLKDGKFIMRDVSNKVDFIGGDKRLGNSLVEPPRRLPVLRPNEEIVIHLDGTIQIIERYGQDLLCKEY